LNNQDTAGKIKVLFLPRWYPNRYDPMPGLFIQHHAASLTDQFEVAVLYVHAEPNLAVGCETEISTENGITVCRVYYRVPEGTSLPVTLLKWFRFFRAHKRGIEILRFRPDITHVHVLTREAVIAWYWKMKTGCPYVISEHWSRYLSENNSYKGFLRQMTTRFVAWRASALIAVSKRLRNSMICRKIDNRNWFVIPNIVDQDRFSFSDKRLPDGKKTILHVSCFEDRSKNISGLLRAFKALSADRNDFICRLIGEGPDLERMKKYAVTLGLNESVVRFEGLKEKEELVTILHESDFLVLTSHYETFGTVLPEAMCCGLPVVSTRVGVADEIVTARSGILIDHDDESIAKGFDSMLDHFGEYDRKWIRESVAMKFSKEEVGKQLSDVYQSILRK
jgi:glycosyltransferase involved in cell wall biosynthesis